MCKLTFSMVPFAIHLSSTTVIFFERVVALVSISITFLIPSLPTLSISIVVAFAL